MRRLSSRNKLFIGGWYIGAGNKPSVISQKPAKVFSKVKELYSAHLAEKGQSFNGNRQTLTQDDKLVIQQKLKKYYQRQFLKNLVLAVIALVITLTLLWAVVYFNEQKINGR